MGNSSIIKRGMCFWFDLDDGVNKWSNPKVVVRGKEYTDHRQYGRRTWLVISNDKGNETSHTCNVIPITASTSKADIPVHVKFNVADKEMIVLCEQLTTINTCQLMASMYAYTLDSETMYKVENALRIQYGIPDKEESIEEYTAIQKVEEIIDKIIESRVSAYRNNIREDSVNDILNRVCEYLEDKISIHSKETKETKEKNVTGKREKVSQIDKFNKRYAKANKETDDNEDEDDIFENFDCLADPIEEKPKRARWTMEEKKNFVDFYFENGPMKTCETYHIDRVTLSKKLSRYKKELKLR